ncbi:MAG: hypothetical protein K5925_01850 [Bacilli bacterium]|nr:hypothetical protein [Bacilli bacterium]
MKKSKLSVGLVASFIGALAMSACDSSSSPVTSKEGELVELVGYNNEKIIIKTDDLYGKYSDSSDGTKLYYDAILEALIRYEYPELSKQTGTTLRSYETLKSEANDKYESARQTADSNASTNGTSFDEEWEKIKDSHNCESDDDLKQYYLYNLEKEELSDWYAKTNINSLKDEYLGLDKDWHDVTTGVENVEPLYPYHILHILVKLSADKSDYNRGTITEAEATKLWQVVRQLIDGQYTFEDVAFNLSDDTSKDQYGDVGIMSTKTSFYNEFKLGIYAYDAIMSGLNPIDSATSDNENIHKALGLDKKVVGTDVEGSTITTEVTTAGVKKEYVADLIKSEMVTNVHTPVSRQAAYTDVPTVPYQVFKLIGDNASNDKINGTSPESGDVMLPRNILFNQFLNFHSPFVITPEDITDNGIVGEDKVTVAEHDFENGDYKIPNNNFQEVNGKKVLCDKVGNVIIGVRSEAGIHFMIMRKSVFEGTNKSVITDATATPVKTKADVSLQDYYTTYIPGEEGYPAEGETYVNIIQTSDQSFYKNRADTIKSALKSSDFDAAYDYRLYEYLTTNALVAGKIHFSNEKVENNIKEYIKLLRESKTISDGLSINNSWETYLTMLRYQNEVRDINHALAPSTCAFKFIEGDANAFKKGGDCYVEK